MNHAGTALVCAALLCLNGATHAAPDPGPGPDTETEFSAKVVAVLDGDTVLVVHKAAGQRAGGLMKIRLAEIDAPEKEQDYGAASRSTLKEMVWHRQVRVFTRAVDKYGRTVAQLEVYGTRVNEEMLRRGMAWEYSHYHSDRRYIAIEREARRAGRGLWAQRDPIPPWQWRLRHVTDGTTSHSTRRANNARQVAGYGEASRLREQPPAAASATAEPLTGELRRRRLHAADNAMPPLAPGDYTCGSKHRCAQMRSCDEAHYYLTVCGVKALNPQGDGMPCAKLCAGGS
jgi:micrococcal nuclease